MAFRYISFKGDDEFRNNDCFTGTIYYYNVRFTCDREDGGGIVLPPSECLPSIVMTLIS